jgi:hypothetical protein
MQGGWRSLSERPDSQLPEPRPNLSPRNRNQGVPEPHTGTVRRVLTLAKAMGSGGCLRPGDT